jgi:Bacterial sugar transferase
MLVNVIRGEMSIVGPSPSTCLTASLNERKPGVTEQLRVEFEPPRGLPPELSELIAQLRSSETMA